VGFTKERTKDHVIARSLPEKAVSDSTFSGSVTVRSSEDGYAVGFDVEKAAHDLGHALAAIISSYINLALAKEAGERDELQDMILDGIACGMADEPDVQRHH
jgi:hypothetical protein